MQGPNSHVTWGQSVQSQPLRDTYNLNCLVLALYTGSQVISPNYDMDAYMASLFEDEAWDLCYELGRAKS